MMHYSPSNFNPRIPETIRPRHASLLAAADSPNSTIPSPTVPTAPIPVHTAYAVPSGRLRVATPTRNKLATIMIAVATEGHSRVNPSEYFSPIENPVSNTPPTTRIVQAYRLIMSLLVVYGRAFYFVQKLTHNPLDWC